MVTIVQHTLLVQKDGITSMPIDESSGILLSKLYTSSIVKEKSSKWMLPSAWSSDKRHEPALKTQLKIVLKSWAFSKLLTALMLPKNIEEGYIEFDFSDPSNR